MVNNPDKNIGDKNIGKIFCQAYLKAVTVGTGIKAFKKCRTEQYDPSISNDEDFTTAETTNRVYKSKRFAPYLDNTDRYDPSAFKPIH